MNSPTDALSKAIKLCKIALPLPQLWEKLQLRGEPGRSCLSPFRDERNPSFSVFQKNDLWFWKDHTTGAGGDEIDLIAQQRGCPKGDAIRLYCELAGVAVPQESNLASHAKKTLRKLVATYDYLDAKRNLVHQTLRYIPKAFRQRRPASEGMTCGDRVAKRDRDGNWWLWTLEGIEPILYRTPELLAVSLSAPVFLCEGEKDADSLAAAEGAVTTTAPMGAGKWRESYTDMLRGRDVIITPDRDPQGSAEAGQKHAIRVASELLPVAARVRIVDWNQAWPEAARDQRRKLDVAAFIEDLARQGIVDAPQIALERLLTGSCDYTASEEAVVRDPRPRLLLPKDGRSVSEFSAQLGCLLRNAPIFNRGGLAMILNDERKKLEPVGASFFRTWIELYVQPEGFCGYSGNSKVRDQSLNDDIARCVLASPQFLNQLRPVRRVNEVRQPVRRDDKTVELLPAGYDERSQILTLDTVKFDTDMPKEKAAAILQKWHQDTAFDPNDWQRSESVSRAMMLAPFCDCMFSAATQRPAFIVSANAEGAGKTTLVMMAIAPTFGPTNLTPPPDNAHKDKLMELLNAVAQAGARYIVFDNWRGKIESAALEAFITANRITGRILGSPATFEADKECLVFITANGASVGGDMRRRSLFVTLFVEEARSEDRKIRCEISEKEILAGRGEILSALWAYVRTWAENGCPDGLGNHRAFPEWSRAIGGILEGIGYASAFSAPPSTVDRQLEGFMKIVGHIAEDMGESNDFFLSPGDLLEIARKVGAFPSFIYDTTETLTDRELRSERTSFARQCEHFKGRTFPNGIKFDSIGEGHSKKYHFSKNGAQPD